jgi:catechol 2,3-dioxygenase-like lactoylglutathione lyase family enzyme
MKLGRLYHVGVATPSIDASIATYRDLLGAEVIGEPFDLEDCGDSTLNSGRLSLVMPDLIRHPPS